MVYPRVGGGNYSRFRNWQLCRGLSPRGRGKPLPAYPLAFYIWSIPVWAGETSQTATGIGLTKVYPRVGGGNGDYPPPARLHLGLSPRGRGKLLMLEYHWKRLGSIPAWAGETGVSVFQDDPQRVYPRVGGGNSIPPSPCLLAKGLSPRGRGKPNLPTDGAWNWRSIPAWAGETSVYRVCSGMG